MVNRKHTKRDPLNSNIAMDEWNIYHFMSSFRKDGNLLEFSICKLPTTITKVFDIRRKGLRPSLCDAPLGRRQPHPSRLDGLRPGAPRREDGGDGSNRGVSTELCLWHLRSGLLQMLERSFLAK